MAARALIAALTCASVSASCATTLGAKPDASVADAPTKGPVGKTFRDNSSKFAACGRDSVSVQTGTTQHITLLFTVDGKGAVRKASVDKMSEPDPDLHDCVLRALKGLTFPPPPDHQAKRLTYPLIVRPE